MQRLIGRRQFPGAGQVITIDGVRVDWPDGFGLIRASNTTPVLVLRFEGQTPGGAAPHRGRDAGAAAQRQARREDRRGGALSRGGRTDSGHRWRAPVNILIVKLSSLGDVVHAMPAVQDIRAARAAGARSTGWWSAASRRWCAAARACARVIACELRRWRQSPFGAQTRAPMARLHATNCSSEPYDAVIDLQGLTKSALVARLARLAPGGQRYAHGQPDRGLQLRGADALGRRRRHRASRRTSTPCTRSRELCARALGYERAGAAATSACTPSAGTPRRMQAPDAASPSCTAPRAPTRCGPRRTGSSWRGA